jgi:ribonucleoside-diphosphate reductase alpha chain
MEIVENIDDVSWNSRVIGIKPVSALNEYKMERFFSREGKSPFLFDIYGSPIRWIEEDVSVTNDSGKIIFTQPKVKRPDFWSSLAIKVVASKYFWGDISKGEREDSVEKIVSRVARYFARQGLKQGYLDEKDSSVFRDELISILVNQFAAFNSPAWFNCGTQEYDREAGGISSWKWDILNEKVIPTQKGDDRPQCSACFIQSVEDNMESIMALQYSEAILFKAGSGTGSNRSNLRSSKEKLTGGGRASGPVSFIKGYDAYAGIIKSGGKTRRAAKMEILNVDHPDIVEFIESKQKEEKKAWALMEQGYSGGMNGEAYASIAFQNCNLSVRVPDEFMEAVRDNADWQTKFVKGRGVCETFKARDIIKKISEGTWVCGDPGMQFDTMFNKWHTCKNSGRINATNPCSEYAFLDDSACNLASINLMKFRTDKGFDVEKFRMVVKSIITAQELAVDGSSYPTEKICKNSHDFRPLGLGYANIGALLMSFGIPYDSDEGRAVAAAITAIMTGEAYKTSAQLSSLVGPFVRYNENREPMLEVINMHRESVKKIDVLKMPENLRYLVNDAWDSWTEALELGEKYGYRNSQVTVLAPTGTIAFLMDCDTTGIEPDIALVKYKVLAGGGMLKIVNKSVALALQNLGYSDSEVKSIIDYIDKNDTIEGSQIKENHLSVFDCAFKAAKGKRFIPYRAHILMMAAVQPFLSGSISKTINMPEQATVDEISEAYIYSWEQGLKAVAIYRENSKRAQPLNTQKTENEMVKKQKETAIVLGNRLKLPQTRRSVTHKFEIMGHEGYLTVGLYDDGKPGEVFITMSKEGSTIRGLMDAWATSVSLNLQYGAKVRDLFGKFRHQKFEPSGFVKNTGGGMLDKEVTSIRSASSIVDYVAQFMLNTFGDNKIEIKVPDLEPLKEQQKELTEFGNEGLTCPHCGGPAKRTGNCSIFCTSCKQTTRSGCGE